MMDHETVRDLFSEYIEGELPPEKARQMDEHLESCEECREELDLCRESIRTLRSLKPMAPPSDLEQKIKRRIRARSRGKFFGEASSPLVIYRVPFELISLILILIAMALFYMMTLVASMEALEQPEPPGDDGAGEVTGSGEAGERTP